MLENWNVVEILEVVSSVIAAASIIAAATPTPVDDEYVMHGKRWYKKLRKVVNALGFNVANAKNRFED